MSEETNQPGGSSEPKPVGDGGQFTQRVQFQQVSARVPESVARGVFSSGALVLNGPHEFIVDFLQAVTRPQQVAARVVLPPTIMGSMVRALTQNIENYTARFGPPMELPKPPPGHKPPSIEEIYDQLKLPDEVASGVYANTVMITHSITEFCFDFITTFYPRSVVSTRIYMATPQVPRLLETLNRSLEQHQAKVAGAAKQQFHAPPHWPAPGAPPEATLPPESPPETPPPLLG
jgi:hypothetical protein